MDIVARLREEAEPNRNTGLLDASVLTEAADTIARLRQTIRAADASIAAMAPPWTPSDHDFPDQPGVIRTVTGLYVNLLDPSPATIELADIAAGLTQICRFGGQTRTFYSVAEHSMHVASMLLRQTGDVELALAGLLHDATEAYIGDMVRPLKHSGRLAAYAEIEATLARTIEVRFDLPPGALDDPKVKRCDNDILSWEMAIYRDCGHHKTPDFSTVCGAFIASFQGLDRAARAARHRLECDDCGGTKPGGEQ